MNKKESLLYINFFRNNLLIFLISTFFSLSIGIYLFLTQQSIYGVSILLETNYELNNVSEKIALTDQIVTNIRASNVQQDLNLSDKVNLVVFKPSPLSIKIELISNNQTILKKELEKITNFINSNYQVKGLGKEIFFKEPRSYLPIFILLSLGFLVGLFFSLIREYLRRF